VLRQMGRLVHRSEKKSYLAHLGRFGEDQLLYRHLLQVAAISARLGAKIGLARAGELIGLMHDIGKYSEAFQQYLREAAETEEMEMEPNESIKGRVDHSTAGAQLIWNNFGAKRCKSGQAGAEFLVLCVASHHSGLIDCVKPDGADNLTRRLNKADADTHRTEVWDKIEPAIRERIDALFADAELGLELDAAFHHHATLSIAAYSFLVLERCLFPPQATRGQSKQPTSRFTYPACDPTTRPEALPVRTETSERSGSCVCEVCGTLGAPGQSTKDSIQDLMAVKG
jgi:CRISPR-associated endonuclease Cas3-HD